MLVMNNSLDKAHFIESNIADKLHDMTQHWLVQSSHKILYSFFIHLLKAINKSRYYDCDLDY